MMPARRGGWWGREPTFFARKATAMIIIGIILSIFAIGFFCWLLFILAVYALPVFVALSAGFAAYHHGYGPGSAILIALLAGGATLVAGQMALSVMRTPILRAGIALAFAAPAGIAGYYASLGVAQLCLGHVVLSTALAATGAVLVFATAWMRMTMFGPPLPGQPLAQERTSLAAQLRASSDRHPDLVLANAYRRSRIRR